MIMAFIYKSQEVQSRLHFSQLVGKNQQLKSSQMSDTNKPCRGISVFTVSQCAMPTLFLELELNAQHVHKPFEY